MAERLLSVLMAEDDPDDRLIAERAWKKARVRNPLVFVRDGQELVDYLRHEGQYSEHQHDTPGLILLDLNMPVKDGRTALAEIKAEPLLRRIPVIVLTTSKGEEDILRTYDLGCNSYVAKPVTFTKLVEVMEAIERYWIAIVELPGTSRQL